MSALGRPAPGGFCEQVWAETADLQAAIVGHPFNVALADGSLDRERFAFYLVQDQRYLVGFAQALAAASTRADDVDEAAFFARSAQTALYAERSLHAGYLERFGLAESDIAGIETAPSALGYVSFLHSAAVTGGYPEQVAAVLPCFWVYGHVAASVSAAVGELAGHPYGQWIATYADEGFAESVETARRVTDRLAAVADPATLARMRTAFVRGCEYEWMFWDAAWRRETWPTREWVRSPV